MSAPAPAPEAIRAAAAKLLADEREPRPDPTAVRIPRDLRAWYEHHAEELSRTTGTKVTTHRSLVVALEAYRAAVEQAKRG